MEKSPSKCWERVWGPKDRHYSLESVEPLGAEIGRLSKEILKEGENAMLMDVTLWYKKDGRIEEMAGPDSGALRRIPGGACLESGKNTKCKPDTGTLLDV